VLHKITNLVKQAGNMPCLILIRNYFSNEELAHLTAAALLMRNEAREAPTLQDICMIRIAENESYFCKQKENPLNNLRK